MNLKVVYNQDFQQWIDHHLVLLREGRLNEIDVENLLKELEDMGKQNLHELENRLIELIMHLLKWQIQLPIMKEQMMYQDYDGKSWRSTIFEQRRRIIRLLKKVPSLKPKMQETIDNVYLEAVDYAVKETKLSQKHFPTKCPYSIEQLLDDDFFPEV